jgi:cytochrome oxidase Cu insertion factor (SCO1/SenC/PrrC family)
MKKKIILGSAGITLAVLLVLCAVFYMKLKKAQALIENVPAIALQTPDGQTTDLTLITEGNISVIIFFHPQCSFCGMEMKEILAHKNELSGVNLIFVTFAQPDELTPFLDEYPMDSLSNGTVLIDHTGDFTTTYHLKSPPAGYVYDRKQKLQKTFRGTTPVSEILKITDSLP